MNPPREAKQSRREMFRDTARVAILGVLGVLSGVLRRRRGGPSAGQDCRRSTPCSHCGALGRCKRSRALAAKRANKR
jgi:hypothetical protein